MLAYRRCENAILDLEGDSVFVASPQHATRILLNEPERVVWELLDGEHSTSDIAEEIAARFRLPSPQAAAAVFSFVNRLRAAGFLKGEDPHKP